MNKIIVNAEVDKDEMACRVAESFLGLDRPPGMTALQAMKTISETEGEEFANRFYDAAFSALEYMQECLNNADAGSIQ